MDNQDWVQETLFNDTVRLRRIRNDEKPAFNDPDEFCRQIAQFANNPNSGVSAISVKNLREGGLYDTVVTCSMIVPFYSKDHVSNRIKSAFEDEGISVRYLQRLE